MIVRRIPMLAVTVAAAVGIGVGGAGRRARRRRRRSPASPSRGCRRCRPAGADERRGSAPACPATGAEGTAGDVVVANAGDQPLHRARHVPGRRRGRRSTRRVEVPRVPDGDDQRRGLGAGAVRRRRSSRSTAAAALVEQRADRGGRHVGRAVHDEPSANWYFAEGFTADESTEQLVLSNPFDQIGHRRHRLRHRRGHRASRRSCRASRSRPRSVQVIDLDSIAARDEAAGRGPRRLPRAGHAHRRAGPALRGAGRLGYSMTLASPALRSQWWFANGCKGAGHHRALQHLQPERRRRAGRAAVPRHRTTPRSPSTRSPCRPASS